MSASLKRSNIEFAKRVFLDRLTTDAQGLVQPTPGEIDQGPGDEYDYGACYDPYDFGVGADCSGSNGIFVGAAIDGPDDMSWDRQFSTETFPGTFEGFRQTSQDDCINGNYPIKVFIEHGGGGPNSHMNMILDGITMESNGSHGTCTLGHGAYGPWASLWNDWWVYDGIIDEDTIYRELMLYLRGLDYTAAISGATLKANKIDFVCRYVTPGGDLQWKCLLSEEYQDLVDNDIDVVFNYEAAADATLGGWMTGSEHAQAALDYIRTLPGLEDINPVVYFSVDFDAAEYQQDTINEYFAGAASVLGGVQYVGAYAGYYVINRLLNAGKIKYAWQTVAWSGGDDGPHIDSRVNIVQRNHLGYVRYDSVDTDINEAHSDDFGQCTGGMMASIASLLLDQVAGPLQPDGTRGWPQLAGPDGKPRSQTDAIAALVKKEAV